MTDEEIIKDDIAVLREELSGYVRTLLALFQTMRVCKNEISRHVYNARQKGIEV